VAALDGPTVFAHACKMGSGRDRLESERIRAIALADRLNWVKMKNPACAAVKREAEEDWR
jgi:hypothetical protein